MTAESFSSLVAVRFNQNPFSTELLAYFIARSEWQETETCNKDRAVFRASAIATQSLDVYEAN